MASQNPTSIPTTSNNAGITKNSKRIAQNNTIKVENASSNKPNIPKSTNNSQPNTIIANNKTVSTNLSSNIKHILNAPKVNTVKKELGLNNLSKDSSSNDTSKSPDTEMIEYGTIITNNYILLVCCTAALFFCIVIYFLSKSFRVNRSINTMLRYQNYQRITSLEYKTFGSVKLGNMSIASAYNAAHSGYQMYDYTSEDIVLSVLQSGARYLEFNVFNSEFGNNAYPVVSMGYKKGEWKMMVYDTPLETIFKIIADNAFTIRDGVNGVNNPDDPIFIGLNLNTNSNLSCLNLISFLMLKYFKGRFLPSNYTYQNESDMSKITLIELMGKIVFFASDGYQGSGLEEFINGCWDNVENDPTHNIQRIHYSALIDKNFDEKKMRDFNKTGLTIVVPHEEGDFLNTNYDTSKAFDVGCHFIAMEFQYINSYMDFYITKFKDKSLIDVQY
jgi:hypothetical protein